MSHQVYWLLYTFSHAAAFNTTTPGPDELDWLSASYPDTFDRHYRPKWERAQRLADSGHRFFNLGLPMLCQTCQIPLAFTEPGDPATISVRSSEFRGERFNLCSDGCQWIFDREPEKYVQAWLPVHQIYQGNCGGATIPDVLAWYGIQQGSDNGEYLTSPDKASWDEWKAAAQSGGA